VVIIKKVKENGISYTSGVLFAYKGDYLYPDGRDLGWDHRVLAFFVGEGRGRLVNLFPLVRARIVKSEPVGFEQMCYLPLFCDFNMKRVYVVGELLCG